MIAATLFALLLREDRALTVAIQPYGAFPAKTVQALRQSIRARYDVEIKILPAKPLPMSAYYKPRNRYRAELLLNDLKKKPGGYDKVLGLTMRDISTTLRGHKDWGLFGLGEIGGRPCVVSNFRLSRHPGGKTPKERLAEVVNHELGHTFGLQHCPTPRCLMADAEGSIKTIDISTGKLCPACRKKVGAVARP